MTTMIVADELTGAVVELESLPDGAQVWVARDVKLDGCIAQAGSREDALAALEEARAQYLAALQSQAPVSNADILTGVDETYTFSA